MEPIFVTQKTYRWYMPISKYWYTYIHTLKHLDRTFFWIPKRKESRACWLEPLLKNMAVHPLIFIMILSSDLVTKHKYIVFSVNFRKFLCNSRVSKWFICVRYVLGRKTGYRLKSSWRFYWLNTVTITQSNFVNFRMEYRWLYLF